MDKHAPAPIHVCAALVVSTAALTARAWLQISLQQAGVELSLASDLSYLIVPPVLFTLLLPVIYKNRYFIATLFDVGRITLRTILAAMAVGLLFRIAWWSQLIVRISFGLQRSDDPLAIAGPYLHYQCPAPAVVLLGVIVASVLIPVIEEIIHRGYVQTVFHKRGPVVAVAISATVFAVFHRYSGLPFALAGGIVLGVMYWLSGSLWPTVVAHAVINLTPQFTWRCMSLTWNPEADSLPVWSFGLPAAVVLVLSLSTLVWLLLEKIQVPGSVEPGTD